MPSASCCFLHVFYIAGNQYQTESKCNERSRRIFLDHKAPNGPRLRPGGCSEERTTHQARQEAQAHPRGLCPPWVPLGPPLCSINTPIFHKPYWSRQKSIPAAAESRTTRSNLDTITEGFTTSIGASPMMCE